MQQSQDQDVWFVFIALPLWGLKLRDDACTSLEYHTYADSDKNAHRLHLAVLRPLRENLSVTQHFFCIVEPPCFEPLYYIPFKTHQPFID